MEYDDLPRNMKKMADYVIKMLTDEAEIERENQTEYDKLSHKQKFFLKNWETVKGTSVTSAAKMSKICRDTVYRWRKENKHFAEFMDKVNKDVLIIEEAEIALVKSIKNGNASSIRFALERLDRQRYGVKEVHEHKGEFVWNETKTYVMPKNEGVFDENEEEE